MRLLVCTQAVDSKDPILGFFHRWIEEMAKRCDNVFVICLRKGDYDLPSNVHVLSLGKEEGTPRITRILRFWRFVLRHISSYNAVFVHMNPEYAILGAPFWKLARKRTVLWYTHKSVTMRLRIGSRLVDTVCTASQESFRLKRKNVVITGHGIDMDAFNVPRERKRADFCRIITVGRITRSKAIHAMLQIVALLPKYGVPFRFSIVGAPITHDDEKYERELMDWTKELGIGAFTGFTGPKTHDEIPVLLAASDVFLHMSDTGSLDKAAIEAMAAGNIVVSSNDAIKPMLRLVQDGLAIEQRSPELFAQAIKRVYEMSDDMRREVERKSRDIVGERHSLAMLIEKLIWILNK